MTKKYKLLLLFISIPFILFTVALAAYNPMGEFASDGCSMFPDGNYSECCVTHDKTYWLGGTAEARLKSDQVLAICVAEKHSAFLSKVIYIGVRAGGLPIIPASWRWGFGKNYWLSIWYEEDKPKNDK